MSGRRPSLVGRGRRRPKLRFRDVDSHQDESVRLQPGTLVKAASLQAFVEAAFPRATDESGDEVPFPIEVIELFESPSRQGYGPQERRLTPIERLTFAAVELLYRDDLLGDRIRQASTRRPACSGLHPAAPTRFLVDHVIQGSHAAGACRTWMAEVVAIARVAGILSLDAMLFQVEAARHGLRPGRGVATRLGPADAPECDGGASPRRPVGIRNRPARDLLARRAHAAGGLVAFRARIATARRARGVKLAGIRQGCWPSSRRGWAGLAQELDLEIAEWEAGRPPDRCDIAYPAWREWRRNKERRKGRDRVIVEDSVRLDAEDLGQAYRKRAAEIRDLLRATLPDLEDAGSPARARDCPAQRKQMSWTGQDRPGRRRSERRRHRLTVSGPCTFDLEPSGKSAPRPDTPKTRQRARGGRRDCHQA